MPETSTPTLTPDATTKVPAFQNNNPGNVELGALKSFILNQAGLANGLATLDENGKLNAAQIPANLDDVLVYGSYALLPAVGESGKLYITTDVNGSYYWNGTSYQMLNNSFVRYRGTVSSLPSNPVTGDWFIAASTFTEGGVTYTSGAIYLYNGSSWDDATAVFGQFVRKSDISQTIGPEIDKVPSNAAVNGAINAIMNGTMPLKGVLYGSDMNTIGSMFAYFAECTNAPTGYCIGFSFRHGGDGVQLVLAVSPTNPTIYIRSTGSGDTGWGSWRAI